MFESIVMGIVHAVGRLGYVGILVMMFLESSFFPFPSEIVIPPAGYLAAQGKMNLGLVIIFGTGGSLLGAGFNYLLAVHWGRKLFLKYGCYLFLKESSLKKAEQFFEQHGHISTFVGRLLPGIRQYISLPAGLARMNLAVFLLFTGIGAGLWVSILALIGYLVGNNPEITRRYLYHASLALIALSMILVGIYLWRKLWRFQGTLRRHQ